MNVNIIAFKNSSIKNSVVKIALIFLSLIFLNACSLDASLTQFSKKSRILDGNSDNDVDINLQASEKFKINIVGLINSVVRYGDNLIIGGAFTRVGEVAGSSFYSNSSGDIVKQSTMAKVGGNINASAVDSAGRIYIRGSEFTFANGVKRKGLARLNVDGSFDSTFPDMGIKENFDLSSASLVIKDDIIYIAGNISAVKGELRTGGAAIRVSDLQLLPWNPKIDDSPRNLSVLGNGKIYINAERYDIIGHGAGYVKADGEFKGFSDDLNLSISGQLSYNGWLTMLGDSNGGYYLRSTNSVVRLNAARELNKQFSYSTSINRSDSIIDIDADENFLYVGFWDNNNSKFAIDKVNKATGAIVPFDSLQAGFNVSGGSYGSVGNSFIRVLGNNIYFFGYFDVDGNGSLDVVNRAFNKNTGLQTVWSFSEYVSGVKKYSGKIYLSTFDSDSKIRVLSESGTVSADIKPSGIGLSDFTFDGNGIMYVFSAFAPKRIYSLNATSGALVTGVLDSNNSYVDLADNFEGMSGSNGKLYVKTGDGANNYLSIYNGSAGVSKITITGKSDFSFCREEAQILSNHACILNKSIGGIKLDQTAYIYNPVTNAVENNLNTLWGDAISVASGDYIYQDSDYTVMFGYSSDNTQNEVRVFNAAGVLLKSTTYERSYNLIWKSLRHGNKLVVAGPISSLEGISINGLIKIDLPTGDVQSFGSVIDSTSGGVRVLDMVISDNKLVACGSFHEIGGGNRPYISFLDFDTGALESTQGNFEFSSSNSSPWWHDGCWSVNKVTDGSLHFGMYQVSLLLNTQAVNNLISVNLTTNAVTNLEALGGSVNKLFLDGSLLYVGGSNLTSLSGTNAVTDLWAFDLQNQQVVDKGLPSYVTYTDLGSGAKGGVTSIYKDGNTLYVGAMANTQVDGKALPFVAYNYDSPSQKWLTPAQTYAVNGSVTSLVKKGTMLYVVGFFTDSGIATTSDANFTSSFSSSNLAMFKDGVGPVAAPVGIVPSIPFDSIDALFALPKFYEADNKLFVSGISQVDSSAANLAIMNIPSNGIPALSTVINVPVSSLGVGIVTTVLKTSKDEYFMGGFLGSAVDGPQVNYGFLNTDWTYSSKYLKDEDEQFGYTGSYADASGTYLIKTNVSSGSQSVIEIFK